MEKPKIYLDTSVISYLDQQDSPEKMEETRRFWSILKLNAYQVCISDINQYELLACDQKKLEVLTEYLVEIEYTLLEESKEAEGLTQIYLERGLLTKKSRIDCRHIALAAVNNCDYIVSWNFKHMANIRTVNQVKEINLGLGYKPIEIYAPTVFLYQEE